jgi:hypothetical protein
MTNLNREIRPEDFAPDPQKQYTSIEERDEVVRHKAELKRLYRIQEEAKAKAAFKIDEARKDQIPYSEALAIEICGRISAGEFLTIICQDYDMPTVRNANEWLRDHSDFAALHREAVNSRLNIFEDELCTIADDSEKDFKVVTKPGKQVKVLDADVVTRAKLRIEVRRAHLRAFRPERWSEQSTLNVHNTGDDISDMPLDELEKKLADLEHKSNVVKAA